MTAPARLLLLTIGVLLALAAPAGAATTSSLAGGVLTVQGGTEGESYTLDITSASPDYQFVVSVGTGPISAPGAPGCTVDVANKVLVCDDTAGVEKLELKAGDGADTVLIDDDNDSYDAGDGGGLAVDGEGGDDLLNAGQSPLLESVKGGAGNDTFNGSNTETDAFEAEPGDDTYRGGTNPDPVPLFPGFDPAQWQLNSRVDYYELAAAGSISLDNVRNDADGLGGTDDVGSDIEELEGSDGNDTLAAGPNAVKIDAKGGDDTVTGSPSADLLRGQAGSDVIDGGGGDDELRDGDAADQPYRLNSDPAPPPPGNDRLNGGDGDDLIAVGEGADDVTGGAGTDTVYVGRYVVQSIDSFDPLTFQPQWAPMTITLDDQANDGRTGANEGDDIRADVEDVDTADVQFDFDYLIGFGYGSLAFADDNVTGSAAVNRIETGPGKDTVDGGTGADRIATGADDDTIAAADKYTDAIDCGDGADKVDADLPGTNPARADTLKDCETVTGTPLGLEGGTVTPPPTAAKLTLGGSKKVKVKAFLKKYAVAATVTTDQAASAAGELSTTGAKIAKVGDTTIGSGKLASGTGKRTLKVKVARKYRKGLKHKLRTKRQRRKGIKLRLAVTVTNGSGQVTTASRTIRVKG